MNNSKENFCPITRDKCKDDCAWAILSYDMNDDGITRYLDCSIKAIGQTMLKFDFDYIPFDGNEDEL